MTTDYRVELQRLVKAYDDHGGNWPEDDVEALRQAVERARAFLSQTEPQEPTDEELMALAVNVFDNPFNTDKDYARAVLARWGRPITITETP